ncbi:MAG: class I SAM-dependent methyltransferase [Nitrospinae bacterium]|nr:class I SAM-dependent methyltransferase [Nitrospinota bacterium]
MGGQTQNSGGPICQICGAQRLRAVEGFDSLPRITSDCRGYPAGGRLFVCMACGGVQKLPDGEWLREIREIYSGYKVYYQSGGEEQIVFDRASGVPRRRSEVIIGRLAAACGFGGKGTALDVGCGNGATIRAMSAALEGWSLSGHELEGAPLQLPDVPGFAKLYTGPLAAINTSFDLVTMIHSLEHFPSPMDALAALRPIVGAGRLFIEVCNIDENPFDILIADHLIHLSPVSIRILLERAGYTNVSVAADWAPKEISALAMAGDALRPGADSSVITEDGLGETVNRRMSGYTAWLKTMVDTATGLAGDKAPFGIFGTSIASTWLASQMEGKIEFFVDEDESRAGREHMGRPIVLPGGIPDGGNVFVALAPSIAGSIAARLSGLPCRFITPPPLQIGWRRP